MNKVIVNVYIPVLNISYDIFIPLQTQLYEVTDLIKKAVAELSEGRFMPTRDTAVSLRSSGQILDINSTIQDLSIGNGTKLMLI